MLDIVRLYSADIFISIAILIFLFQSIIYFKKYRKGESYYIYYFISSFLIVFIGIFCILRSYFWGLGYIDNVNNDFESFKIKGYIIYGIIFFLIFISLGLYYKGYSLKKIFNNSDISRKSTD